MSIQGENNQWSIQLDDISGENPVDQPQPHQPQGQPEASSSKSWFRDWRNYVFLGGIGVIIIILVLVLVLGGSKSTATTTCGALKTPKPTTGSKMADQCPSASGGVLTCDDTNSTWYCKCGDTANLTTYESTTCTTPSNPTAYCGTNAVASCGCGGAPLATWGTNNPWCTQTQPNGLPTVAPMCKYDSSDSNDLGTPACQCGSAATKANPNANPMITSVNYCADTKGTASSWVCNAPKNSDVAKKFTGVVDCACANKDASKADASRASLESAYNTCVSTNKTCKHPSVAEKAEWTPAEWNTFIKTNCKDCDMTCTGSGWTKPTTSPPS